MKSTHRKIRGLRIVFEDDDLIVIEKEAGILTCSTRMRRIEEYSVEAALTDYVRKGQTRSTKRVYLVHRLDRETSGVMMVAKSPEVQDYFRSNWNDVTTKIYLARVMGAFSKQAGVYESYLAEDDKTKRVYSVTNPEKGKFSRTEWEVVSADKQTTLMKVTLKSGRKNQIRVHFSEAKHPIVGDTKYGLKSCKKNERLCLHAWRLSFIHPRTKNEMTFDTPLPLFAKQ